MFHARRQPDAETPFAWPPTREDLDLIEVVDADTLRPVHALCDEPELATPMPPELLKDVTPVRPAAAPVSVSAPAHAPAPTPAPARVRALARSAETIAIVGVAARQLIARGAMLRERFGRAAAGLQLRERFGRAAAGLQLRERFGRAAAELQLRERFGRAAAGLQLRAPLRLDKDALIATGGVLAIACSAYLSLRPSPSAVGVEPVMAAPDREQAIPRFTAAPFARMDPMEMSWWLPPARASAAPVSKRASLKTRSAARDRRSSSAVVAASVARNSRTPTRPEPQSTSRMPATLAREAPTQRLPPTLVSQSPPRPSLPSLPTLMARAPVVSNVAMTMPSSVQTIASVADEGNRVRDLAPPSPESTRLARASGTLPTQSNQQIYAALHQYERAYERLDAKAVRAVWPTVDARALERAFRDLKSQTLEFDRCDIDVGSLHAKAACRGRARYETRAGDQAARTEPREWTFTLQKSREAWRIVSASAR